MSSVVSGAVVSGAGASSVSRWRVALAAALALLLALGLSGCGVPDHSDPVRVGAPRQQVGQQPPTKDLPVPDGANGPDALVRLYLQASAWGNSVSASRPNANRDAGEQVRKFLTPDAAAAWQPGDKFQLVRVTWPTSGGPVAYPYTVPATVETVGLLNNDGSVTPADTGESRFTTHSFTIVDQGGGKLRIQNPLSGLVFDVGRLLEWYLQRTIYFWGTPAGPRTLIPDIRYLPRVVGPDRRPTEVLGWLLAGPVPWLAPTAQKVHELIEASDNVVVGPDNKITINLTAKAAGLDTSAMEAFLVQARWSLSDPPNPPIDVELQVQQAPRRVVVPDQAYRDANPAVAAEGVTPPSYCVLNAQVRPAKGAPPVPLLDRDHNRDVIGAAIASNRRALAYVRNEPGTGGRTVHRLVVATGAPGALDTSQTVYLQSAESFRAMGRPAWLSASGGRLLVVADGELRIASIVGNGLTLTRLATAGSVTAVAVAPDGRRIAYVANGKVFLAALRFEADQVTLAPQPREIRTDLERQQTVGWLAQDRLVVGGKSAAGSPLVEVSVDGTQLSQIERAGLVPGMRISQLSAVPDSPNTQPLRYLMMLEADVGGVVNAYDVFGTQLEPLSCLPEQASPPPSAQSTRAPGPVTAPFFQG